MAGLHRATRSPGRAVAAAELGVALLLAAWWLARGSRAAWLVATGAAALAAAVPLAQSRVTAAGVIAGCAGSFGGHPLTGQVWRATTATVLTRDVFMLTSLTVSTGLLLTVLERLTRGCCLERP